MSRFSQGRYSRANRHGTRNCSLRIHREGERSTPLVTRSGATDSPPLNSVSVPKCGIQKSSPTQIT
jgi:hypothetical protein